MVYEEITCLTGTQDTWLKAFFFCKFRLKKIFGKRFRIFGNNFLHFCNLKKRAVQRPVYQYSKFQHIWCRNKKNISFAKTWSIFVWSRAVPCRAMPHTRQKCGRLLSNFFSFHLYFFFLYFSYRKFNFKTFLLM